MTATQQQATAEQPNGEPQPQPSKAVARVGIGVPLTTLDETKEMAKTLAVSALLPYALRGKPADVFAQLAYGMELGLGPMQSIQAIYVVKGKPQISADLWTAKIRQAGHKVRWGACDNQSATVTIVRKDDPDYPHTVTYTIDDAVQAGLCELRDGKVWARSKKDGKPEEVLPWEKYTRRMLMNRAVSFAGKAACPEVLIGFSVEGDMDYIDDEPTEPLTVTQPDMHREPIPQDELQRAVAEAEQAYRSPTMPTADATDEADIQDAEVVDDPPEASTPQPPTDPEQDLFAATDAAAEAALRQGEDGAPHG